MTRIVSPSRGYFGLAVYRAKTPANVGLLLRSAHVYGAAFVATVGVRYPQRQATDVTNASVHIPLHHYTTMDDLLGHLPRSCPIVGVELDPRATSLESFTHPDRALYLLGAEDTGLPPKVIDQCHYLVQIPAVLTQSLNVAVAGSIAMASRHMAQVRDRQAVGS
jgi:tRNA G18 (ribose-2'-O)-methylase SpoU